MAEFKIARFKYNWKGDWSSGTDYIRDDIVRVNGKSYVCLITHTASSAFADDLNAVIPGSSPPQSQPKWIVMTGSRSFVGNWQASTNYNLGDIVLKGSLYVCTNSHTSSSSFDSNIDDWEILASHISYEQNWTSSTTYAQGELTRYNGIVYKCIVPHTSQSTLEDDLENWEIFYEGIFYVGAWTNDTEYRLNDLVQYGSSIYKCIETHTSVSAPSEGGGGGPDVPEEGGVVIDEPAEIVVQEQQLQFDHTKFELFLQGAQFDAVWSTNTRYQPGDVVRHGGFLYYCQDTSQYSSPYDNDKWLLLSQDYNFRGQWSASTIYAPGDVVQRGGYLYKAKRDISAGGVSDDGSTIDYLDETIWELILKGTNFRDAWSVGNEYLIGDAVYHLGSAYICNFQHTSSNENFPGDNGNIYDYWDTLNESILQGGLHDPGDLLTYGLNRTVTGDESTLGLTRVPIGNEQELLSIQNDDEIFWRNYIFDTDVIYVSTNGVDADGYGLSKFKPFRTVKYACQYVLDNYSPLTPTKISVATGRYEEVCPMIIPAGCVVMGDELRSTTIVANSAIDEYQDDYQYLSAYLDHFGTFVANLLGNIEITPSEGNTLEQVINEEDGSGAATEIVSLTTDLKDYIQFNIASGATNPTLTGTNDITTDFNRLTGASNLETNIAFVKEELYYFLVSQYPEVSFNKTRIQSDILEIITSFIYDLRYPGNYRTLLAGIHYSNAVNGSQLTDMFYVRDTTGIRNCTLDGLQGTLNPPGVFELYQRPTGGSYVSLDPGWGPDDTATWIVNRSPYLQGVTNLGSYCVGMKVDGSLHNGGNKSMVANDFTQVVSDGIGAWVTNNARVELVSVFTYYCAVGYLAEDGGVIRATNGNNSYGRYGAVSDGNDPDETPDTGTVNNRTGEALVSTGFAGGSDDRIFVFEYENAGEQYTSASAEIIGAGDFAAVEYDDFRDQAMFEPRLINTQGSGSEGGSNYLVRGGSAQITSDATSTIKISASDPTQFESEILGMRILIVSGQGAGQYGYIAAYNNVQREVTVRKESDGELGWDHVIPGTPIESSLDSTATYRIEPRIEVSHPGYTATAVTLSTAREYVDIAFGGTTATYTNIVGQLGTGDVEGISPIAAVFRVDRAGDTYTVTNTNPGAGYITGDTITILGTSLGGSTPDNDITITITETTDDSTASIVNFTSSGTPRGPRYVALANPNFISYSDDGLNWTSSNTSFAGTFVKIIAGNNVFVALAQNENRISFSYDGVTWLTRSLPSTDDWCDIAFGDGKFIIISNTSNTVLYSATGLNWSSASIPAGGDSTVGQWQGVAYGQGKYIAVSGSGRAVAISSNGSSWTRTENALPVGDYDFAAFEYGANRFLGLTTNGNTVYSVDGGSNWYAGASAPTFSAEDFIWTDMKYYQGVFLGIGNEINAGETTTTTYLATTEYGLDWTERAFSHPKNWKAVGCGNIDNVPTFIVLSNSDTNGQNNIETGCKAKLRSEITTGSYTLMKIWDCGSGYKSDPTITVTDNQFVVEVEVDPRIGNGVLAQPSFINRGQGYRTSSSTITITGNGYADVIPEGNILIVDGVDIVPGPGVQIRIASIEDEDTVDPLDLKLFSGVVVTDLGDDGSGAGTRRVQFTISPRIRNENNLEHGTVVTLRSRYSQCRVSGHDFLDIGTGNFIETNYPEIYAQGNFFVAAPENEVLEQNGGRVFYTSTDQDGNFRAGELFAVNQATGVVTISAEFFDLDGLSELALGGVRLGGSGAVIREFSTDGTFSEDSNNVVPTQRAIATFLADRLSVGGENLETNLLTAGTVQIGGENNIIGSSVNGAVNIPVQAVIDGPDAGVKGHLLASMMFYKSFKR